MPSTTETESSVEPSSTTTSSRLLQVCESTLVTASPMVSAWLRFTMRTLMRGSLGLLLTVVLTGRSVLLVRYGPIIGGEAPAAR